MADETKPAPKASDKKPAVKVGDIVYLKHAREEKFEAKVIKVHEKSGLIDVSFPGDNPDEPHEIHGCPRDDDGKAPDSWRLAE